MPNLTELSSVYSVIVILVYGWTIYWSFWKLPSWLDFLPLSEIGAIYCYLLATNFVESLITLFGVVFVSLLLPEKWFRDVFVSRGSMLSAIILISIMNFEYHYNTPADYFNMFPMYFLITLLVACVAVFFAGWIYIIRKVIEIFAENATIFLYIMLPLSLLSIIVILIRNLIG